MAHGNGSSPGAGASRRPTLRRAARLFGAVVAIVWTWPNPPWQILQIAVPLAMGLCPVLLFPFSRTLWLALDWTFRPPTRDNRLDHPRPGRVHDAA